MPKDRLPSRGPVTLAPLAHTPAPPSFSSSNDDLLDLLNRDPKRSTALAPLAAETPTLERAAAPRRGPTLDHMFSLDAGGAVAAPAHPAREPAPPRAGGPTRAFPRASRAAAPSSDLTDAQRASGMAALDAYQPSDADLLTRAHADLATMHHGAADGQNKQKWGDRLGKAGTVTSTAAAVSAVVPGGQVATAPLAAIGAGLKVGGNLLSAGGNAQEAAAAHQVSKYTPQGEFGAADAVVEHAASKGASNVVSAVDAVVPLPLLATAATSVGAKVHEKSIQSRLGAAVSKEDRDAMAAEGFQAADHDRIERGGRGRFGMLRDRVLGREPTYGEGFTDLGSDAHQVAHELRTKP